MGKIQIMKLCKIQKPSNFKGVYLYFTLRKKISGPRSGI